MMQDKDTCIRAQSRQIDALREEMALLRAQLPEPSPR